MDKKYYNMDSYKSNLFHSSHSSDDNTYKSGDELKEKYNNYKGNISSDNFSDKSEKSYISNKNDDEKKQQSIIKNIKKNHNVYEVISIVCESINFSIRLHIMACDIYGDIIEYKHLDNIYLDVVKKEKTALEKEKISKDINIFLFLLKKIKPDIIVVGIRDVHSYLIYSYIVDLLNNNSHGNNKDNNGNNSKNNINSNNENSHKYLIIPENLYIPCIVTNSLKYSIDLTNKYSREALVCLSLCRFIQNPLCVLISLFDEENRNMFNICLHDLQKYICSYKLESLFLRIIIDVVNKTGFDINFLKKKKKHLGKMISYISGLGLRKGEEIMKLLHNKNLNTREDLLTLSSNKNLIGKCVYRNCSSFIRIIGNRDEYVEALDNTRIHPLNCYDIIHELIKNSVDKKNNFLKNTNTYDIVNYIIDKKKFIKNMEIKEYSRKIYDEKKIYIYPYLKFVKNELLHPYKDYRYNYKKKKEEELFYLIINEKKENLTIGSEVVCRINYINKNNNYIKITILPYNVRGVINDSKEFLRQLRNYYNEKMNLINANLENINSINKNNFYNKNNNMKDIQFINNTILGELIKGRIVEINYNLDNKFETNIHVVVTEENIKKIKKQTFLENLKYPFNYDNLSPLIELDINHDNNNFIENHFKKLNDNEDFEDCDEDQKIKIKNKNKYYQNKKFVNHPNFKLWNYQEIYAYLKQQNISIGEAIIYPSNEINKLYLLIKTSDNPFIVAKFTIIEKNIQLNSLSKNMHSVQQIYIINNEQFNSIDQIISILCENLKKNLLEIYKHPKCKKRKTIEEVRKELYQESLLKPDNIVWSVVPPILSQKNKNETEKNIQDFNPLRFTLMVIPPYNHHQHLYSNFSNVYQQKDLIVLHDSIYVDHKSFKLWTKTEKSFKNLINWWKEKGYWNRQNERQEYMNEKKKKMEEYKKLKGIKN